jgi:hypothetical protein
MENQRIIQRPNCLTSQQWEALSREEQIAWWISRAPVQEPSHRGPLEHLASYQQGALTDAELQTCVFESLTELNVMELDRYPEDLLQALAATSAELPADDDETGWCQMIRIFGGMYAPGVTPQDIQQAEESQSRRFREGVGVFRARRQASG